MKKSVIITGMLMLFVLAGFNSASAQQDFCFTTSWDDTQCSCSVPSS